MPLPITSAEAPKTVLQSLVPSMITISSRGAWLSSRVGKRAVPLRPSRKGSSKTVVLPQSPSSMIRAPSFFIFSWRIPVQRTSQGKRVPVFPSSPQVLESPKHRICLICPPAFCQCLFRFYFFTQLFRFLPLLLLSQPLPLLSQPLQLLFQLLQLPSRHLLLPVRLCSLHHKCLPM